MQFEEKVTPHLGKDMVVFKIFSGTITSMSIYTKTGDSGKTSLFGSTDRISKGDKRIELVGTLDELNSILGFVNEVEGISDLQSDLFSLGSFVAGVKFEQSDYDYFCKRLQSIEELLDQMWAEMPELRNFILPGGCWASRHMHLARSVCRRLERAAVRCFEDDKTMFSEVLFRYINRLSDLLFVFARYLNYKNDISDVMWHAYEKQF